MTDEVLQEPVLTVLGRARVGLERHHLLAHQRGKKRIEVRLCLTVESGKPSARECLAEHRSVLEQTPFVERAIVDSGILLLKYWLEVSEEEQTRRLQARIDDGRKLWKLSPMDLESYSRWYDYSRARDEMFAATDTGFAPWYVARSDDKRRARLNLIRHLLSRIPYKDVTREEKVKLPKRQKRGGYRESDYPFKYIPEKY